MIPSTHPRQIGIHKFLTEVDTLLGEFHDRYGKYPPSDLTPWYKQQRVKAGRKNFAVDMGMYSRLSHYLDSKNKVLYNRISSAKFIYVTNISLRNFVLGLFQEGTASIVFTTVDIPDHADLKSFLVPEDLILSINQNRFFKIDWI